MSEYATLFSCEHAGNQVPIRFHSLFPDESVLDSDLGWDVGALDATMNFSEALNAPCFTHQTTRLLIDVDRSLGNEGLFSDYSKLLNDEDKLLLLDKYYFPFRLRVQRAITTLAKPVIHFSIHTSKLEKNSDTPAISILCNESCEGELAFVSKLKVNVSKELVVRSDNYTHQDFISYLRTQFNQDEYLGIKIKIGYTATADIDFVVEVFTKALVALRG